MKFVIRFSAYTAMNYLKYWSSKWKQRQADYLTVVYVSNIFIILNYKIFERVSKQTLSGISLWTFHVW